jgi:hypothetical protein
MPFSSDPMAGDIRYGDHITVSIAAAAVIVDMIGLAEKAAAAERPAAPTQSAVHS